MYGRWLLKTFENIAIIERLLFLLFTRMRSLQKSNILLSLGLEV